MDMTAYRSPASIAAATQAARKEGVKVERKRRLDAGTTLALSYGSIPVQGREFDQSVILGLSQRAVALQAAGDTTTTLTYRDKANTMHELTAVQFLELSQAAMTWVEAVMSASWTMTDAAEIPEDFADDVRWPS